MNKINHVAIIMDGNGRWALQKGKSRNYGHQRGLRAIEKIVDYSIKKKISYLIYSSLFFLITHRFPNLSLRR